MRAGSVCGSQRIVHHRLRLTDDGIEVRIVFEALRIDLVDGLGTRWAGCEPAAARDHLEAADRGIVARGAAQLGDNRLAG